MGHHHMDAHSLDERLERVAEIAERLGVGGETRDQARPQLRLIQDGAGDGDADDGEA
jgi:hypothetical protein